MAARCKRVIPEVGTEVAADIGFSRLLRDVENAGEETAADPGRPFRQSARAAFTAHPQDEEEIQAELMEAGASRASNIPLDMLLKHFRAEHMYEEGCLPS